MSQEGFDNDISHDPVSWEDSVFRKNLVAVITAFVSTMRPFKNAVCSERTLLFSHSYSQWEETILCTGRPAVNATRAKFS